MMYYVLYELKLLVAQLCLTLCNLISISCQAPVSTGFPRQEYQNGLPFPSPGDLPDPGSNLALLNCRQILYRLSHLESVLYSGVLFHSIIPCLNSFLC